MMKRSVLKLAGVCAGLALASAAQAALVTQWQAGVDTRFDTLSNTICDSNGDCTQPNGISIVNNKSLRWGDSTGSGQSGLDITASPITTFINTDGPSVANVSVTHLNRPITGFTLSSANILSTLTLTPFIPSLPGLPSNTITFGIKFKETTNADNPCADGGANGVGVNINGCADIFVIDQNSLNFAFQYDTDGGGSDPALTYYISFFEATNGLNPLSSAACSAAGATSPCLGFETREGFDTTFQFAALITSEPVQVPEPGSLALLGLGLAGLSFQRRKSKK